MDMIVGNAKATQTRLTLIVVLVLTSVFVWFAASRQLGSAIAELTAPTSPEAGQVAEVAISLAPADPVARWLRSSVELNSIAFDRMELAVGSIEDAVRLSPFDYR